ncbi:AP-3 complex subunit beta [Angomonas deanei]|uniref:Adaptin N terminal region/non-SMC mitotic condensation complex subunit 1, putative n=1 Tax=Angomonas deanei TaxID=59799 RepID=A0A7G2C5B9_9TRYP|nr:AP-3 complex subunit beta [Angomonas deanei]CAD2213122.1 Adaptin N terminal region/non-SMC mitotic condensation complex subunit 1, putative [Angomonas deanei]|eukprot:EPY36910.1 AP-3 complex subunit beta [Angomonas deanei]
MCGPWRSECSARSGSPPIYPVVMVAVQKCSQDITAHVRKTAAIALTQLYALSPEQTNLSSVKKVLSELLADKNADVVGAAAMAFNRICPDDVDVIHPVFMNLCTQVNHAEEIGQVFILKLLLRYCRLSFKNVEGTEKDATTVEKKSHSASSDDESSSSSSSSSEADLNEEEQMDLKLDRDLLLVLRNVRKLLRTTNSAVLIAVCNIYFFCSPKHHCTECIKPLVRFVGSGSDESLPIILSTIHGFICQKDCVFEKYYKDFYVNPEDARDVYLLKIAILGRLVNASNADDILNEFKAYVHGFNTDVVLEGIQGLQRIASAHPEFSSRIVRLLQPLFSETNPRVVADAISVFRLLVMQKKESEETSKYVFKLMNQVVQGEIVSPVAVKSVLWLVGENIPQHEAIAGGAPDCFRVFLKQFPDLDSSVKEEVLILGCKIWFHLEGQSELSERFKNMYLFALKYASFDDDYVIRDLGRMVEGTKERDSPLFQLAKSALLSEKPSPSYTEPHSDRRSTELGTLTNYLGFPVFDYKAIPEWTETPIGVDERHPASHTLSASPGGKLSSSSSFYSSEKESSSSGKSEERSDATETDDTTDTDSSSEESSSSQESDSKAAPAPPSRPTNKNICPTPIVACNFFFFFTVLTRKRTLKSLAFFLWSVFIAVFIPHPLCHSLSFSSSLYCIPRK